MDSPFATLIALIGMILFFSSFVVGIFNSRLALILFFVGAFLMWAVLMMSY